MGDPASPDGIQYCQHDGVSFGAQPPGFCFLRMDLALWYSPFVMADFSFYLFRLPNAPGNGDRFFVVKVFIADAQGRTKENRLKKEWATTKFTHFVARTLKSASSAKFDCRNRKRPHRPNSGRTDHRDLLARWNEMPPLGHLR